MRDWEKIIGIWRVDRNGERYMIGKLERKGIERKLRKIMREKPESVQNRVYLKRVANYRNPLMNRKTSENSWKEILKFIE